MLAVVYVSDFFFITCSGLILFWVLLFEQRFAQSLQPRCTEEWHLGTPPPFPNLYILLHNLLYDHSIVQPHITVRSTVEGALAVSCCRMGWGWGWGGDTVVLKGSPDLCFVCCVPLFAFVILPRLRSYFNDGEPTQESSRTAWWITLHPQAQLSHVLAIAQISMDTYPHTHTSYSLLSLTFLPCIV